MCGVVQGRDAGTATSAVHGRGGGSAAGAGQPATAAHGELRVCGWLLGVGRGAVLQGATISQTPDLP